MTHLYRRIRTAFALTLLLIALDPDSPLFWALLCAAYVACVTYAAGDAWLLERERRSASR